MGAASSPSASPSGGRASCVSLSPEDSACPSRPRYARKSSRCGASGTLPTAAAAALSSPSAGVSSRTVVASSQAARQPSASPASVTSSNSSSSPFPCSSLFSSQSHFPRSSSSFLTFLSPPCAVSVGCPRGASSFSVPLPISFLLPSCRPALSPSHAPSHQPFHSSLSCATRPSHLSSRPLCSLSSVGPSLRRRSSCSRHARLFRMRPRLFSFAGLALSLFGFLLVCATSASADVEQTRQNSALSEEANICRCLCDRASGAELQVLVPASAGCGECTRRLCVETFAALLGPPEGGEDAAVPVDAVSVHCIDRRAPWIRWIVLSFLVVTGALLLFAAVQRVAPFMLGRGGGIFGASPVLLRSRIARLSPPRLNGEAGHSPSSNGAGHLRSSWTRSG
ncbi:hypothetical protein BESB_069200 [Besnoitia besnoiti]|uniref:Transmembrane protein n=1 Tax=Besnoitia besnoiti TaxID=94643 RepID=A0A2A9MH18_BESBE|nr:hypothetical protein BESB_069200 [Besnoitia besnoiti]PFH34887.1 hypothetical protein BESB_069200 [Besnoitia besnoiti]